MQTKRLLEWIVYSCVSVFLASVTAFSTGYKFWGRPQETWQGLNSYLYLCGLVLFILQFSKYTRVVSWWALPVMGYLTFILFDPSDNYAEIPLQIAVAAIMSAFAYSVTKRRKN